MKPLLVSLCASATLFVSTTVVADSGIDAAHPLEGTWTMTQAYEIHPDGSRTTNYGEHPIGRLIVDAAGRYSLQIFRPSRPAFASGDKTRGTAEEYRQASVGSSTHFGRVAVDAGKHQLTFDLQAASFPNWEGKRQVRDYTLDNDVLSYAVPASASGSGVVAYSVWRRERGPVRAPST
ncbi:MAG TPA: lipocalin-like domain-containing protein [Tahibacter sp.]|uniref:lipocalin-like domain-containing protein n=1 Tax=Tahibacter sp. TaxID=2056211 RepID=UPI002C20E0F6|nr:lipocalin-like domain-containing protein [Tahibacter sp.]HSX59681.1 lipocalin-like domain-containing protein [Tahibacter sp.]